ncbi:MAG: 3-dehydroquinate synthase [Acidimicrobiales bacterium]
MTGDPASTSRGTTTVVRVPLPAGGYDVVGGPGARHRLAESLPGRCRRAVVVTQAEVGWTVEPGLPHEVLVLPPGEAAKTLANVERLCRSLASLGLTRADVVVGVGGGVVTDIAGFVAAIYHRGVAVVHVPTTLLAQVDAAIGGKCGVNLPEGKNLVGAFWQPAAVLCDTEVLATLPERERASGLGEMAKYAFLGVDGLARLPLAEQVARCVAHKAAVVVGDERDSGGRALLNYGHTLAHALETDALARGGDLRHGEAVAIGLVFAARLAERLGRIGAGRFREHVEVVESFGLSQRIPAGARDDELLALMGRDKKATDGLTFVLDGPQGPEVVAGVDAALVGEVLASHPRDP